MRFWREQKALIIQPTRCRSEGNMVDILSEGTNPKQRQVFHSRTARSFDEGQVFLDGAFLSSGLHTELSSANLRLVFHFLAFAKNLATAAVSK